MSTSKSSTCATLSMVFNASLKIWEVSNEFETTLLQKTKTYEKHWQQWNNRKLLLNLIPS